MNKYAEWLQMSLDLKELKEKEMKRRKELCAEIFEGKIGKMKKKFMSDNYEVVAESGVGQKIDKEVLMEMWEELDETEKAAVKWDPSLVAAGYKLVKSTSLLNECITTKPSSPTLKVREIIEE